MSLARQALEPRATNDDADKRILLERGMEPAPERRNRTSWKVFLKSHGGQVAAADFFTVEVLTLVGLVRYHVLFVIDLKTRRIKIAGIAHNPQALLSRRVAPAANPCARADTSVGPVECARPRRVGSGAAADRRPVVRVSDHGHAANACGHRPVLRITSIEFWHQTGWHRDPCWSTSQNDTIRKSTSTMRDWCWMPEVEA